MKRLSFILLALAIALASFAQDNCYSSHRSQGIDAYNAGDYTLALKHFKYIQEKCSEKPSNNDISTWIQRCNEQLNPLQVVGSRKLTVGPSAETKYVNVTGAQAWTVSVSSGNFFSVSKEGERIKVSISANNTGSARTGRFHVRSSDGSLTIPVDISQSAAVASTSTSSSSSSSSSTSPSSSKSSSSTGGSSNGASSSSSSGSSSTVSAGVGGPISVNAQSLSFLSSGGTQYLTVSGSDSWMINGSAGSFFTAIRSEGNRVKVTVYENHDAYRSGSFYIRSLDGSQNIQITVSQARSESSSSSTTSSQSSSSAATSYGYTAVYNNGHNGYSYGYRSTLDDYYANAGEIELTWFAPQVFVGTSWGIQYNVLNLRLWLFEMQFATFAVNFDYDMYYTFYYQPDLRLYIPISETWAVYADAGPRIFISDSSDDGYGSDHRNIWFKTEFGFRVNPRHSCASWDLFFRYNGEYVGGIALNLSKGW